MALAYLLTCLLSLSDQYWCIVLCTLQDEVFIIYFMHLLSLFHIFSHRANSSTKLLLDVFLLLIIWHHVQSYMSVVRTAYILVLCFSIHSFALFCFCFILHLTQLLVGIMPFRDLISLSYCNLFNKNSICIHWSIILTWSTRYSPQYFLHDNFFKTLALFTLHSIVIRFPNSIFRTDCLCCYFEGGEFGSICSNSQYLV